MVKELMILKNTMLSKTSSKFCLLKCRKPKVDFLYALFNQKYFFVAETGEVQFQQEGIS